MEKRLRLDAYLVGFNKRKDGSYTLRFETQELPHEMAAEFARLQDTFGELTYQERDDMA